MKVKEWTLYLYLSHRFQLLCMRELGIFFAVYLCVSSCLGCTNGKRENNTLRIGNIFQVCSQILLPAGLVAHSYIAMHHANYCTSISKICQGLGLGLLL